VSKNLVSGLYKRIKETKLKERSDSKSYNELVEVTNGLISFVNRNPDITNDDIKMLASTNEDKFKYFSFIFYKFPNLVEEIRNNGSKNVLELIETKKENAIYDNYAYVLNKCINIIYKNHKKNLYLNIRDKYNYKYFKVNYKKSKSNLIFTEESESIGGSSGFVRGLTNITMKDLAQVVGLVSFYKKTKISEETLREIVKNNYTYDFLVIEKIFKARSSILEELNQDQYGMIQLINLYEYLNNNEKQQEKADLL